MNCTAARHHPKPLPGPALRDRPLQIQRQLQCQKRPPKRQAAATASTTKSRRDAGATKIKGARVKLLPFDSALPNLRMNRALARFTESKPLATRFRHAGRLKGRCRRDL